jgi:hypothetical protein
MVKPIRLSGLQADDKFRFRGLFSWAKISKTITNFLEGCPTGGRH